MVGSTGESRLRDEDAKGKKEGGVPVLNRSARMMTVTLPLDQLAFDGDLGRTEAVVTRNSHFPIRFIDKKKKQMWKGTAYCKVHRYKVCVKEETERWIER